MGAGRAASATASSDPRIWDATISVDQLVANAHRRVPQDLNAQPAAVQVEAPLRSSNRLLWRWRTPEIRVWLLINLPHQLIQIAEIMADLADLCGRSG